MGNTQLHNLIIDKDFRKIFVPKSPDEISNIEHLLTYTGFQPTIITWNKMIIEGYETYKICHRLQIPFQYEERKFFSKNEVISTICLNSLKERNLTNERYKYCIGKLGKAQHALIGENYNYPEGVPTQKEIDQPHFVLYRWRTSHLLKDFSVSMTTVYKYGTYALAIDNIYAKTPDIALNILDGHTSISLPNTIRLSQLSARSITEVWKHISAHMRDSDCLAEIVKQDNTEKSLKRRGRKVAEFEIKKMPEYDPDAEFSSLALTIPMWNHSLTRFLSVSEPTAASLSAINKLNAQLLLLKENIEKIQMYIQEACNE